jgi:hypothetical protein
MIAEKVHLAAVSPQGAAKLRRFKNKAMGVSPDLFTAFGVWPGWWAGDMVTMQMRSAHHLADKGQRSTNCLRPDGPGNSETRFSLWGI